MEETMINENKLIESLAEHVEKNIEDNDLSAKEIIQKIKNGISMNDFLDETGTDSLETIELVMALEDKHSIVLEDVEEFDSVLEWLKNATKQ